MIDTSDPVLDEAPGQNKEVPMNSRNAS
jgi:hypothetical protein